MAAIRLRDIIHNRAVYRQADTFLGKVQALLDAASVKGFETDFNFRYWLVAATAHHSVLEDLKGIDEILHWRIDSFLSVIESYLADRPVDRKNSAEFFRAICVLATDCRIRSEQRLDSLRSALFLDEAQ
ncbi:hypothetical protein [Stutzerimonas nitrititolerans]|uniref:hypothetical protein n=1 Tax=Stutzerimonas nitrititolerans TaxID=2482751 RepID=UPI0028AC1FCF|nr:hypothetical protein [Stutzerimonas nitrititolerans]